MSSPFQGLLVLLPNYQTPCRDTTKLVNTLVANGATLLDAPGQGLIDRLRSDMASKALTTEHAEWLWLDADTSAPPGEVERLIESRRRHDADVMMAPYVTKERPAVPALVFDHGSPAWPTVKRAEVLFGRDGYVYPALRVGFGCTMTHRRVFEKLAAKLPEVRLQLCPEGARPFFHPIVTDTGDYIGEDYSFCDRARGVGGRVLVDTRIRVGHVGEYRYFIEDVTERPLKPTVIVDGFPVPPVVKPVSAGLRVPLPKPRGP